MLVRWFGESWNAACCDARSHTATPEGTACAYCNRPIEQDSQGLLVWHIDSAPGLTGPRPWHLDCWLQGLGINDKAN
jgi:hypothetical protein